MHDFLIGEDASFGCCIGLASEFAIEPQTKQLDRRHAKMQRQMIFAIPQLAIVKLRREELQWL
jgi:hypothetical protein